MSSGMPVPRVLMDGFIYFLQVGSTEFTNVLFTATGAVLPEKRGKEPKGVSQVLGLEFLDLSEQ
jgi:hypothetical protein